MWCAWARRGPSIIDLWRQILNGGFFDLWAEVVGLLLPGPLAIGGFSFWGGD